MSEEDQSWIVPGAKVFEYTTGRMGYEPMFYLRTIESVAPKSFVVRGDRIRKDKMERRTAGYTTYYYINPESDRAKNMIRSRELSNHYGKVRDQAEEFSKGRKDGYRLTRDQRIQQAEDLIEALQAFVADERA